MKKFDYIIAIKTVKDECEKNTKYKIYDIFKKGDNLTFGDIIITYQEDTYFIIHNNKMTISNASNFKYDYKSNRKLKLKKLNDSTYNQ